ncbi:MAG TPA: J domain-containing protein [Lysobacter sp.]|nr:J domain-containing protein [Lysobacter sp.]
MREPIQAFPLQWPTGWKRTPSYQRDSGRFGKRRAAAGGYTGKGELTVADAVARVREQLRVMRVRDDDLVVSTNLTLRLDGWPRSNQPEPQDPGVAVYWRDGGETRCMAIDRYRRVADNLAAIAATLEAMRAIERHGGAEILTRAFAGFAALPGPSSAEPWWEVLGVPRNAHATNVEAAYRRLRSLHHPDRGGDAAAFHRVQEAYEQWQSEARHA